MSSKLSGLLSATFVERGYEHLLELVHQRDGDGHRRLASVEAAVHAPDGRLLGASTLDPAQDVVDLGALTGALAAAGERLMVTLDTRYDDRIFPYRPHHYAYVHRRGSSSPPLYYAVNAALGGVPDRVGATRLNNFETYVFPPRPFAERYAIVLGNLARFAPVEARVYAWYGSERVDRTVHVPPRGHTDIPVPGEHDGRLLERVELKTLFRLASYVTGRRETGELVLFDHLFTYFK
jgi:hypothetical protein